MQKKIAVCIACYNEEKTIEKVIDDYKTCLPNAKIYVYDNNSTDSSFLKATMKGAIVKQSPIQGKGAVYRQMFKEIDADYYITVDADDTYPTDKVHEMLELIENEKADMVIGDRLHSSYFTENKRPFHNSGNIIVRGLINFLYHSNISDVMSGSRVMTKKFVKNFPAEKNGFEVETELTMYALNNKMKILSVVIPYQDRVEGSVSKLNTVQDGLKVICTIFKFYFKKNKVNAYS